MEEKRGGGLISKAHFASFIIAPGPMLLPKAATQLLRNMASQERSPQVSHSPHRSLSKQMDMIATNFITQSDAP